METPSWFYDVITAAQSIETSNTTVRWKFKSTPSPPLPRSSGHLHRPAQHPRVVVVAGSRGALLLATREGQEAERAWVQVEQTNDLNNSCSVRYRCISVTFRKSGRNGSSMASQQNHALRADNHINSPYKRATHRWVGFDLRLDTFVFGSAHHVAHIDFSNKTYSRSFVPARGKQSASQLEGTHARCRAFSHTPVRWPRSRDAVLGCSTARFLHQIVRVTFLDVWQRCWRSLQAGPQAVGCFRSWPVPVFVVWRGLLFEIR